MAVRLALRLLPYAKLTAMYRMRGSGLVLLMALSFAAPASGQSFEVLGTRAAGMAGAFVAVADDASAVYWNPAGLATGAFFSLLVDRNASSVTPDDLPETGSESGSIIALSTPALGLGYYRLRLTRGRLPDLSASAGTLTVPAPSILQLDTLVTHHTGVTLVQSVTDGIALGATLKLVRGVAAADLSAGPTPGDLLDRAADLVGRASNKFDADLGVIATFGRVRAGLSVRNTTQPEFETSNGLSLRLTRQVRAGVALSPREGVLVAADLDLERAAGPLGEVRDFAVGAEAGIHPRVFVRSGFRLNTLDDQPGGHAPVVSAGGSYAILSSVFVDAQVTGGSDAGPRGWGIAARVVF